jgi:hypothetical protein
MTPFMLRKAVTYQTISLNKRTLLPGKNSQIEDDGYRLANRMDITLFMKKIFHSMRPITPGTLVRFTLLLTLTLTLTLLLLSDTRETWRE